MAKAADPLRRGMTAPDFELPGTDGRTWKLADVAGPQGVLVMFICNHCPYVQGAIDRIVRDVRALRELCIESVAISSNDALHYPEDSFDNMKVYARRHGFDFPYLYDESQQVARAYGAVCTPDFFGFDGKLALEYRGRLDAAGRQSAASDTKRELVEAMRQVAQGGHAPDEQTPSMGCSIKWKVD